MEKFKDKKLYEDVKKKTIEEIPKHSAYRSALIVKRYKEKGGRIKEGYKSSLNRWFKEDWINVYAYLKENKKIKCGDSDYTNKSACRPLKRINKNTPITIDELLTLHGRDKIIQAINKKNKDPKNKILQWKNLNLIKK
jgi:hypothetical protein